MAMDAVELLEHQHREVEDLFERFEGSGDDGERQEIATQAIAALRMHTTLEEELFYPAVREQVSDADDTVLEGYEEHHAVELLLDELDGMKPSDERYTAKFTVIKEQVLHHVEEEESQMFPQVRDGFDASVLSELGERMATRADELKAEIDPRTKEELYAKARELDIQGRAQMSKRQLSGAVTQAE